MLSFRGRNSESAGTSSPVPPPPPPPLARAILAQKDAIFGALAVGNAAVAWWQLFDFSRTLSALKSAREMTLAEISREKQPADAARGSIGTSWRGLVALRGFVQAGQAGVLPWDRPPPLLPDHGGQQPCAFMERTETILQPNLHLLYGWVMKPSHMIHIHKSIPFSLAENMHPSAPRVNISLEGATQRLPLYATYSHIRKAHPSWGDAVLRVLIGKPLPVGMHTEEKVLPINHEVTAVGHVRFGSDGRPAIFASPKFRYFLFSDTKAGMLQKLNHEWAVQLLVCLLLSAAAAVLVGFAVRRRHQRRRRGWGWVKARAWGLLLFGRRLWQMLSRAIETKWNLLLEFWD